MLLGPGLGSISDARSSSTTQQNDNLGNIIDTTVPERFEDLPLTEQERIRTASALLASLADSYANWLLIGDRGPGPDRPRLASCFAVKLDGHAVLFTASHVLKSYVQLRARRPNIAIQVGGLMFSPENRLLFDDEARDIAALSMAGLNLEKFGKSIPDLSQLGAPSGISSGQFVQLAGYPAFYREDIGPRESSLACLTGFVQVIEVAPTHFYCRIDRDYMIELGAGPHPPKGTILGGLSGGPVLLRAAVHYPIVAIVTDYAENWDLWRCSTLDSVVESSVRARIESFARM